MSETRIQNGYPSQSRPVGGDDGYGLNLDEQDGAPVQGDGEGFGDGFVDGGGAPEGSSAPISTYEQAQGRLDELLTQAKKNPQLESQLNQLKGQVKNKHGKIPQELATQIQALEAQVLGESAGDNGEDPSTSQDIKKLEGEIDKLKIPDDKKQELKSKLHSSPGGEGDGGSSIDEVQQQVDLYKKHSYAAVSLAEQLGGSSETGQTGQASEDVVGNLEKLAQKHGINLDSPPNPPTKEMLEFLKDASPELADKFAAVKQAADARSSLIQKNLTEVDRLNAANKADTSDHDDQSVTKAAQAVADAKYYQGKESGDLVQAMQDATKDVKSYLDAIYSGTGQKVDLVQSSGGSGWQATYNQALAADKLTIGGNTIDLFNNTTGEIQAGAEDKEDIQLKGIAYDNEGDGKWMPSVNTYGEKVENVSYDDGMDAGTKSFLGGTAEGAGIGAAVGSVIPFVGTGVGAVVGGAIGAIASLF